MRSPDLLSAWLAAGAVAVLLPPSALAQTQTPPPLTDVDALIARATQAMETDDKPEQLNALRGLITLSPTPKVICTLGQVERRLQQWPEAAEHLTKCIADPPPGKSAEWLTNARGEKAMARGEVGILRIVAPPGAHVTIDGEPRGPVAREREYYLEAKKEHHIEVRYLYDIQDNRLALARGDTGTLEFRFPAPPPFRSWPVFGSFMTAGALALGGVVVYGVSEATYSEAEYHLTEALKSPQACYIMSRSPHCDPFTTLGTRAALLHNTAIGLWVAAGAIGAAGATIYLVKPGEPSPRLTIGLGMVRLEGTW